MAYIPESELILNPDGSIYHLNLRPEQVANTIITVGDQNRVAKVSKHFDRIESKSEKREFFTHTGWIGNKRLSVISTGIGPDNIDIVFTELDALFNIDFQTRLPKEQHTPLQFIRIGTSGCLQEKIPVDSFLISRFGIGLDNLLHFYEYSYSEEEKALSASLHQLIEKEQLLPVEPYVVKAGEDLVNTLSGDFHEGITLTAPGFYAPQGRELRAKSKMEEDKLKRLASFQWKELAITNFEMETSAMYGMANMLGHQAISCNALIANRYSKSFSKDPKLSIEKLIVQVLEKLTSST
jgi:uridine phosphorylase